TPAAPASAPPPAQWRGPAPACPVGLFPFPFGSGCAGSRLPPAGPPCWAWFFNDVPACRGLAVVWLIRGARAPVRFLELGVPATVLTRGQEQAEVRFPWWR